MRKSLGPCHKGSIEPCVAPFCFVFKNHDCCCGIRYRYVITVMFLERTACHCPSHHKPHEQLDALRSGIADEVVRGISRERFGIVDDLLEAHQVEFLIDETRAFTIELMR